MFFARQHSGKLRSIHDRVVDLRNKRFAHIDDHDSVSNALEVSSEEIVLNSIWPVARIPYRRRQGVAGSHQRLRAHIS